MSAPVKAIPDEYPGVTAYAIVRRAAEAIDFYKKVFHAKEVMRFADGARIGHAELIIGKGRFFLADEYPEHAITGPESLGGSGVTLHLYVDDVDRTAERFVAAGGKVVRAVEKQFYGDRGGRFTDPFGQSWWIAQHVEDVPPEQLRERADGSGG